MALFTCSKTSIQSGEAGQFGVGAKIIIIIMSLLLIIIKSLSSS